MRSADASTRYDVRRPLLVALLLVVVLAGVAASAVVVPGLLHATGGAERAARAAESSAPATGDPALAVLRRWDRRRAAAWSAGDVAALHRLYLPGSAAGERDASALRAWTGRGLRVRRLDVQVLAVRVVRRTRGTLVLRVTDRVVGATAVGGGRRVRLPEDAASTRVLRLVRRDGRWLVASVRDVG